MERLLTISDAVKLTNLPEKTIRGWMQSGDLLYVPGKAGKVYGARISPKDLEECIERSKVGPKPKVVPRRFRTSTKSHF